MLTQMTVQLETVVFDGNHKFSDPPSAETDAAWASLTEGRLRIHILFELEC